MFRAQSSSSAQACREIDQRPARIDDCVEGDQAIAGLEVFLQVWIRDASSDPECALLEAIEIIVDDDMVVADDANPARSALAVA